MKKKILNNFSLKVLSLVVAVLVWMAIVNITDPTMTKTITNIEINVTDQDVITNKNQVFKVTSRNSAAIVISGKRSIVSRLEAKDFTATAPLSEMSQVNAVPVYVTANNPEDRREISIIDKTVSITVAIEDVEEKEYDLEVEYVGTPRDGYVVDKSKSGLKYNKVKIKAPQSIHNLINKVAVNVDVEDAAKDFSGKYEIALYNKSKSPIPKDGIEFGFNNVQVNTTILKVKEVPINYSVMGKPASGYLNTGVKSSVSTIKIVGRESLINDISEVVLPTSILSIEGRNETLQRQVNISSYLPQGVSLLEGQEENITITVIIEQESIHSFSLSPGTDIKLTKIPEGYAAKFTNDAKVTIQLRGLEELFNDFDVMTINPIVDLSHAQEGENEVQVQVTPPEGMTFVNNVTITVTLVQEEGTTAKPKKNNKNEE